MKPGQQFSDLPALITHLRGELENKKVILLYAYNGTGKTRLSMAFKDMGKPDEVRDTLYFNAFTEDLFHWNNDLEGDVDRRLLLNRGSRFFQGLFELEMDNRIRPLLRRYADFDFRIDTQGSEWAVRFSRLVGGQIIDNIKVSRGEENIFIWCFFLAVVELAMDPEIEAYQWVKYLYIDDPISSLDEGNAVMVAHHLAQLLADAPGKIRTIVSTHHVLFFNVLCNETKKPKKYFLAGDVRSGNYLLNETDSTPFLYHLASLVELNEAEKSGALYTHHFNMMRRVMEQTACFFGYSKWNDCIKPESDDPDQAIYKRIIDLMSHGDYSLYEPREMMQENKELFGKALKQFIKEHPFSETLFS